MSIDRSPSTPRGRLWLLTLTAIVCIVAGAATLTWIYSSDGEALTETSLRLSLQPPDQLVVGGSSEYPFGLALAPDGRRLVFPGTKGGVAELWLRDLTTDDVQPLAGTAGGVAPFWSPDGRAVAFFAAGKLRVFQFDDGRVWDVADAPNPRGGVWHPSGDVIFAPDAEGPLVRRTNDGQQSPLTALEAGVEISHRHPRLAPGGRHVVFYVHAPERSRQGIWIAPLDAPQERRRLVNSDAHGLVVDNALVYSSGGALVAQHLDLETLGLVGQPLLLGTPVGRGSQHELFATAAADLLVYGTPASGRRELLWLDRHGATIDRLGEPMEAWDVRVSPAAPTVAVARVDPQLNTLDIWTYEEARPVPRRMSQAIDADETPAWSHDGLRLAWVSGRRTVTMRGALAELPELELRTFDEPVRVSDWSPDAQWIVLSRTRPGSRSDIVLLPASGRDEPQGYAESPFNEAHGMVSPDGRWMAYASDESGQFDIYVDTFPTPSARGRLTVGGGTEPRWSRDGREIFFRRGSEIHVVRPRFNGERPEAVASERLFDAGVEIRSYDVSADGERFLLNVPAPESAPRPMTVLVNVSARLKALGSARF